MPSEVSPSELAQSARYSGGRAGRIQQCRHLVAIEPPAAGECCDRAHAGSIIAPDGGTARGWLRGRMRRLRWWQHGRPRARDHEGLAVSARMAPSAFSCCLGLAGSTLVAIPAAAFPLLVVGAHMFSRWCASGLIWRLRYVRVDLGKAAPFAHSLRTGEWLLSGALGLLGMAPLSTGRSAPGGSRGQGLAQRQQLPQQSPP